MEFEWDEEKRRRNILKHRIDFADTCEIFGQRFLEFLDHRRDYGEDRWKAVGLMKGRLVTVVYTERGDVIRIISARRASSHEKAQYHRQVQS